MQTNVKPSRTADGQREMETRAHKISWQARALLAATHGDKTLDELAYLFKSPETIVKAAEELVALNLIAVPTHAATVTIPEPDSGAGITPLQQARQLLNDTAMGSTGLLGGISALRFTLKLERCYSAEELRAIYPDYRRLVTKSKGEDFVNAVLERVEGLLATI